MLNQNSENFVGAHELETLRLSHGQLFKKLFEEIEALKKAIAELKNK